MHVYTPRQRQGTALPGKNAHQPGHTSLLRVIVSGLRYEQQLPHVLHVTSAA